MRSLQTTCETQCPVRRIGPDSAVSTSKVRLRTRPLCGSLGGARTKRRREMRKAPMNWAVVVSSAYVADAPIPTTRVIWTKT